MPTYSYRCTKCDLYNPGQKFPTFEEFKAFKCPTCGAEVSQTYETINYTINGYSHNNEYKGKTMYRDHVKKYAPPK